ncbi:MAG: bifunctional diaminohydroxyphosphoribosylaminopyrimidine deaminase/5-amino-6-(5-phosphoribosylamino)uracil reductase RibD, partial [Actinomycetota bacterium]
SYPVPPKKNGGTVRQHDEHFMTRALELSRRARRTSPNPRVGCVVVRAGEILAEGFHERAGTPHAEALALARAADAAAATVYVSLEPCVHRGRTPPCVDELVEARVGRVVVAMTDPDERVAGRGVEALRAAGIEVAVGILSERAEALNRAYCHHRRTGRPLLSLKLALSLDGRLAAADGSARWITGPRARRIVHVRRREADAVMVGAGTVLADDPSLTARDVGAVHQPATIVVDAVGRVPSTARLFSNESVLVATTNRSSHVAQLSWKEGGAEVLVLPEAGDLVDLDALLDHLGDRGMLDVLCEGGAALATSLLAADLVDEVELHHGPLLIGGGGPVIGELGVGTMADARRWRLCEVQRAEDVVVSRFVRGEVPCSPGS